MEKLFSPRAKLIVAVATFVLLAIVYHLNIVDWVTTGVLVTVILLICNFAADKAVEFYAETKWIGFILFAVSFAGAYGIIIFYTVAIYFKREGYQTDEIEQYLHFFCYFLFLNVTFIVICSAWNKFATSRLNKSLDYR
ncbi:MAG: hypothetical protein ABIO57_01725 [Candidatus Paceibacterota bacterium]